MSKANPNARKQIVIKPRRDIGPKRRGEPVVYADLPTYELETEHPDGTWTVTVPDTDA